MKRQLRRAFDWLTIAFLKLLNKIDPDAKYLDREVPASKLVSHSNWFEHLVGLGNHEGMRILEIGSREVSGKSSARQRFAKAEYIGFDYYAGPNVDIVGDAHQLSSYFAGQKFDLIYSSAVFEHLAMPWIVSSEILKLLKVGGVVFVETHFSFSSHERPWHFFQFSDLALRLLFPPAAGIECIEAGMSNPIIGRFASGADAYLRHGRVPQLYCHSEFLGRKVADKPDFDWRSVRLDELVGSTHYPAR